MMAIQFLVLLLFSFSRPQLAMSKPHDNSTDLEALLAIKAGLTDPRGLLAANWTANTSFCNWAGVYCSPKRRPPRVVALILENVFLRGAISPHVGNLSFLSLLHLGTNNLTGTIPDTIARLPRLAEVKLLQNYLSGEIPAGIFNMSSLVKFSATYNNLSGPLPSSINLPRLELISLSKNQLTGPIPPSFGRCSNLQTISLSYNQFTGAIPAELGNITALSTLYIGENELTGSTIPTSIGNLTNLEVLDAGNAYLEGRIPEEFGNLLNLRKLNLGYNSLTGTMPTGLLNATKLYFIQLFQNNLTGTIPSSIGEAWPQLTTMNFAFNQFSGGLDFVTSLTNCRSLNYIVASGNPIEGVLPDSVGNLTADLRYFLIDGSLINGKIPVGFGNLSNLLVLDLAANQLTGELPSDLWRLEELEGIYLDHNRISGTVPFDLGKLAGLNVVMLEENTLSGSIPDSVGNITGLQHLSLAGNGLSSSIPDSIWRLEGVIDIDLSRNTLQGTLPTKVGGLEALDTLDLSENRLSGNISTSLGGLKMLGHLDLSKNSFRNQIPESLGGLTNIKYLNLSHNALSGAIPRSLASLPFLASLDLSFNELEGQIPRGRVFSNSSIPSLKGNADLCGAPQLGFETCSSIAGPSNSKKGVHLLKYILPPVAFVVVLVSCFYLLLVHRRRNIKDKTLSEDPSLSNLRAISYYELVRATDNFSDANLLGKGGFSSVFKGCLDDGLAVAVKVFNLEVQGALKSFDAECRALGMLRHRNLVKVISACSNLDFKALVLEFMPNGNLEQWLHSHDRCLDLHQRLDIMVGVALAVEYLHHDHPSVVLHSDLKPSNVLLDEHMAAHVADFGIAKMLLGDGTSVLSASAPGTIGYIAPEYGLTGKISRKGDVYSFGILLLETLTRKRPSDAAFDGGSSLRQWVCEAYPDGMSKIVDDRLLSEDATMKPRPEVLKSVHQCLSSAIELGLACSEQSPKERVSMRDVVPMLQKIRGEYVSKALGA
ncbi:putative LRR receptor-like serine/threonine-protein kinase [Iris pallida]|uniref:non-specific serine/threonine protein kinase n=1 Tax=Iris pallida TaxID=29817 RepID=A0AAX6H074_IRIPA|nr:putative LRR receptor-like serine/threonine-protein kinase [Iris pallida]